MSKSASWCCVLPSASQRRRDSNVLALLVIPAEVGIQCLGSFLVSAELPPCRRVTFLCWHKEKSPKESAYGSRQKRVGGRASRGFSDSPSWLGRKTAHIHVRRPSGLHAAR